MSKTQAFLKAEDKEPMEEAQFTRKRRTSDLETRTLRG